MWVPVSILVLQAARLLLNSMKEARYLEEAHEVPSSIIITIDVVLQGNSGVIGSPCSHQFMLHHAAPCSKVWLRARQLHGALNLALGGQCHLMQEQLTAGLRKEQRACFRAEP